MSASPVTGGSRMVSAFGGEMLVRLASAAILAAISLVCAWLGGWPAGIAVGAVVAIVHWEWIGLTKDTFAPAIAFTVVLVVSLAVLVAGHSLPAIGLTVLAVIVAGALSRESWRPLGVVYAAVLGFGLLLLRLSPENGLTAVLFLFAVVWGTDTGAYFTGRALGGPKLWPAVSPKKTWAGSIGGLGAGIIGGLAVTSIAGLPLTLGLCAVAVLLSVAGQAGDLFESAVKRHFGAKDASHIIPGHGGLMDRVDGLVFAAGLAALLGWVHGGGANIAGGLLAW